MRTLKNETRNILVAVAVIVVAVIAGFIIYKHHNNQVAQANAPIAVGNVIVVKTPCNKSATVDAAQDDGGVTTTMMDCIDTDSNGSMIEYEIDSYIANTATTEQEMVNSCNQSSYTASDGSTVSWVDQQTVTYNSNQFNICAMQSKGSIFEVWGYGYNKDSLSSNSIDGYQSSAVNIKVDQGTNPSASDMWSRLKYVLSSMRYE